MKIVRNYLLLIATLVPLFSIAQSDDQIRAHIARHRPSMGAAIPANLSSRLGVTHVGGKYHLTDKPFIVEGTEAIERLGYGILKLWFDVEGDAAKGYPYNSEWNLPKGTTLAQLAAHPYYKECFKKPFSTIILSNTNRFPGNAIKDLTELLSSVEQSIYELSKYLLESYHQRDVTFIIQNWEGDWLLRGGTGAGAQWHEVGAPTDWERRVENMAGWFAARQRGVERARAEVKDARCRVMHAIEANRVVDGMKGVPSVASHVLPRVEVDLVSWSAYDGVSKDGVKMYKGIDYLRQNLRPSAYMQGRREVLIGEIGYPENIKDRTRDDVVKMWDTFMAVYLAQKVEYIIVWELYCNELKNDEFDKSPYPLRRADELRGFWLIRPDGSRSWTQEYLGGLLLRATKPARSSYDVLVYGSTAAGVTAAIQAAKMGKSVAIVSLTEHIGGVASSGLGATDINRRDAIGGLSREFYERIYTHYSDASAWGRGDDWRQYAERLGKHFWFGRDDKLQMQWMFEPHVARKVYDQMLAEAGVEVICSERLDLHRGVEMKGKTIRTMRMESGREISAKMFIDATYEGDLMAKAGVSYFVGREANSQYGETMNGVLPGNYSHKNKNGCDVYLREGDPTSGVLPFVEPQVAGKKGDADHRIQAYCYRFTLTNDPDNRREITKPERYEPIWFEHIARWIKSSPKLTLNHILTLTPLPNRKTDTNHADFVGASYRWPEGDYATRDSLAQMHRDYVLGLLWFLASDNRVRPEIRRKMLSYGLPKDEFADNGGFPYQIYVREARRMVSDYVMSEGNITGAKVAPEAVGLATYWFDSHVVSRYADESGKMHDEGSFWSIENVYPVSYRSIRPRKGECENLLVPVCIASSHAAYGSIRMEPVYMVLGQSAGAAAAIAIDRRVAVQRLDYSELKRVLIDAGQIIDWEVKVKQITK